MQKRKRIFRFFLPTDQNPTKAVHPTMGAFDHPTPGTFPGFLGQGFDLFAARAKMGRKPKFGQQVADFPGGIPLVQTHPLGLFLGRLWTFNHQTLNGLPCQLHLMPVGPVHRQADRDPVSFREHPAFDPALRSVGGIWSRLLPPPTALWSSRRPCATRPNLCLSTPQIGPHRLAPDAGRPPPQPTLDPDHGPASRDTSRSGQALSISSRCARPKKWPPHTGGRGRGDVRHPTDAYSHGRATSAATPPTGHQKSEPPLSSDCLGFVSVSVWSDVVGSYTSPDCQFNNMSRGFSDRL
jgi:hypothetical protein